MFGRLLCFLFGHKFVSDHYLKHVVCVRCGEYRLDPHWEDWREKDE